MSVIQRVTQHYLALGVKKIVVPEWGLTVHAKPLTIAEQDKLLPFAKKPGEYYARLLVMKALNAAGKPLFEEEHRFELMQAADWSVVQRVAEQILSRGPGITGLGESSEPETPTPAPAS